MENKELTAKEVLETIGEICGASGECGKCPLDLFRNDGSNCHQAISGNAKKTIEIAKKWKADHTPIETEWRYICRIIKDTGSRKECVYEENITESVYELPFEGKEAAAEGVLKKYCKNHKGKFFATVEYICRAEGD